MKITKAFKKVLRKSLGVAHKIKPSIFSSSDAVIIEAAPPRLLPKRKSF